jgi:hypothetical protein
MNRKNQSINLLLAFTVLSTGLFGQTRPISGRVISEHLETLPRVRIQNSDTILITETDMDGRFTADIELDTKALLISWIGMEWTTANLSDTCASIEVVMMIAANYDYKSHRKIDRDRRRRFNGLIDIHRKAFNDNLFKTNRPCFDQAFVRHKPQLDRMRKMRRSKQPSA